MIKIYKGSLIGDVMFEALRKKIGGWFKREKKEKVAEAKKKKEKKPKKPKKEKPAKKVRTKKEFKERVEEIKEEIEEEKEEVEEKEEKKGFFSRLVKKLSTKKLSEEGFEDIFSDFGITLLENNVALDVVDKIKGSLAEDLVGKQFSKKEVEGKVMESLKSSVLDVLMDPPDLIKQIKEKTGTYTIIFFGINGSGKTTSIAKLAHKLKKEKISCVLAAADTFRAASIEQLQHHGEKVGVKVISHSYGSDPAAVAFDAKKYAEKNGVKVVLVDTAGRMYTKTDLLREMEKIVRVSEPDLKMFVGESITGNDAIEQARKFKEAVGIDGIVLSKADVDEKAGTILSVSYVTGKPIYFLGVGQKYEDLKEFSKKDVLKNIGLE
jgi:fused signal recognition particle receptor